MVFVTFWHMSSANLPQGTFHKRRLSNEEARVLVAGARRNGKLVCTAKAELAAPYKRDEFRRHLELCEALTELLIPIAINDFFGEVCSNVLQSAYVGESSDLLFVDSCYSLNRPPCEVLRPETGARIDNDGLRWDSMFTIDPASITFDLYSLVEVDLIR